jgi:hypothetical protein
MIFDQTSQLAQLAGRKSAGLSERDWPQPEFRQRPFTLNVNMRWFAALVAEKENAVWANARNRGHRMDRFRPQVYQTGHHWLAE